MSDLAKAAMGRHKPSGKVYTDADTRKWLAGPGEEVGPWTDVPRPGSAPKQSSGYFGPGNEDIEPIDWEGDIERSLDVLRDANLMGRRINNVGGTKTQAESALEDDARAGYKQAFVTAPLVGASFAGGPVGSAAMAALLGDSALEFAQDPSAGNAVGVGLSALPLAGKAFGAVRGARAARAERSAVDGIKSTYGAGDMGAYQRGMPKPGALTPANPQLPDSVERLMGGGRKPGFGEQMLDDLKTAEVGPKGPMVRPDADGPGAQLTDALAGGRASLFPRETPAVAPRRVPAGVSGDEFAGVQPYGPSTKLSPEEAAAEDEFWQQIMAQFGAFAR
jgi:hypothetical protein